MVHLARVGTLGGTTAYEILLKAQADYGVTPVSYDDDVHPYEDLVNGRVDAVLLDNVLAFRRSKTVKGYTVQPESVAIGHYVGVLSKADAELRDSCNAILRSAMQDGTLERILRKWQVWNDDQAPLQLYQLDLQVSRGPAAHPHTANFRTLRLLSTGPGSNPVAPTP